MKMRKMILSTIMFFLAFLIMLLIILNVSFTSALFFEKYNTYFVYGGFVILIMVLFSFKQIPRITIYFLIAGGLLPSFVSGNVKDFQEKIARETAINLITKIEHYHSAEGKYPSSLEQLVPKYIDDLPKYWISVTPKDFNYEVFPEFPDTIGFGLQYRTFGQATFSFNGNTKEWFYND
ncbi:MAG: hypothetical protein AAFY76_01320 [Cyanobacteria bacterium J06649_11]